jgi:formylglycine-generating enzyme required for sulfatase activity
MEMTRKRRPSRTRAANICGVMLAAALCVAPGAQRAFAETQSVIDPTEVPQPPKSPAAAAKKPIQPDAALKRERQRAEEEQRRRAKAEARAQAAENEAAKLRATQQAQAEAAAKDAAEKAAARKAAEAKAAAARAATEKAAARKAAEVRAAAAKAAATRAAAARATAAKTAQAKIAAEQWAAEKEAAAREAAAREAAAQEAAAKEAAAKEAAAKETAARETATRLAAAREAAERETRASRTLRSGTVFRDCADCPEIVWLPQGEFIMGEASTANSPRHVVRINYMLAVGRYEVTFVEWDACVTDGGCRRRPYDSGWGRGRQPVINVSWADAQQYSAWLSRKTGKRYRLLSEAEWEYAARAGSHARFWWGNDTGHGDANCYDCGSRWDRRQAAPVGSFAPNPFGLYDMHGNVSEWVEDCYHDRYRDAPNDGRAWTLDCSASADTRIVRGGAWHSPTHTMRSAGRSAASFNYYDNRTGFRIARTE